MNVKDRAAEWKKHRLLGNESVDTTLFREIVRKAKVIENRPFGFKISKASLLKSIKFAKIEAFNGFRSTCNGSNACYRITKQVGFSGGEESLTIHMCL